MANSPFDFGKSILQIKDEKHISELVMDTKNYLEANSKDSLVRYITPEVILTGLLSALQAFM